MTESDFGMRTRPTGRQGQKRRILGTLAVGLIGAAAWFALSSEGSTSAASSIKDGIQRVVHWQVASNPRGHVIRISSEVEHCTGYEVPRYGRIELHEDKGRVYIRAFAEFPKLGPGYHSCLPVGYSIFRNIALRRDVKHVRVYDSRSAPPRLRWPR
jgi:hypothetical protein